MMRSIGMDVHRSFAQVAICDDGQITDSFKRPVVTLPGCNSTASARLAC